MTSSTQALYARLMARARLRHLQLLVAVADDGTVKRAAAQVGMSQPAATQAIVELERLLEVTLFERRARGMRVTAAGQVVLPVVRQVLHALQGSIEALSAVQSGASGLLRVGFIPAAVSRLLTPCLAALAERSPGLELRAVEGTPAQLLKELAAGSLDLVLTRRPAELGGRYRFEPLLDDEAVFLAGTGHPLAGRPRVSVEDLAGFPWMRAPEGVRVRDLFDALFAGRGPPPVVHPISTSSPSVILSVLEDNRTVALGPFSVAEWYLRRGLVTRLAVDRSLPMEGLGAVFPAEAEQQATTAAMLYWLRRQRSNRSRAATPPGPDEPSPGHGAVAPPARGPMPSLARGRPAPGP